MEKFGNVTPGTSNTGFSNITGVQAAGIGGTTPGITDLPQVSLTQLKDDNEEDDKDDKDDAEIEIIIEDSPGMANAEKNLNYLISIFGGTQAAYDNVLSVSGFGTSWLNHATHLTGSMISTINENISSGYNISDVNISDNTYQLTFSRDGSSDIVSSHNLGNAGKTGKDIRIILPINKSFLSDSIKSKIGNNRIDNLDIFEDSFIKSQKQQYKNKYKSILNQVDNSYRENPTGNSGDMNILIEEAYTPRHFLYPDNEAINVALIIVGFICFVILIIFFSIYLR